MGNVDTLSLILLLPFWYEGWFHCRNPTTVIYKSFQLLVTLMLLFDLKECIHLENLAFQLKLFLNLQSKESSWCTQEETQIKRVLIYCSYLNTTLQKKLQSKCMKVSRKTKHLPCLLYRMLAANSNPVFGFWNFCLHFLLVPHL